MTCYYLSMSILRMSASANSERNDRTVFILRRYLHNENWRILTSYLNIIRLT
jgi:hypothetical protein